HCRIDAAGVFIQVEDLLPSRAAVAGLEDAALRIGGPAAAQRGDVDDIGVFRMNDDAADVLCFLEAHILPRLAAVAGFVDAVAPGDAVAGIGLAGADPD